LIDLARLIEDSIRDSDMCARYGGEEFALVLYHTDEAAAFYLADRLRQSVEQHEFQVTGKILNVTVSIGIATYPNKKISSHAELIKCADQALYRAKGNGRNRVEAFVIPQVS
jgi:diguanylate cyclase (GGDEF)-like protein